MSSNPFRDAVELYQGGRLRDAQKLAQRCVDQAPDHPEARRLLAVILADRGELSAALEHVQHAVLRAPGHLPALATLADLELRSGDADAAENTLRRALHADPRVALLHSNLGTVLVQQGRMREAVQSYGEALRLQPDFDDALLNQGRALMSLGELAGAAACLERYLARVPTDAEAQYTLGSIRAAQHQPGLPQQLAIAIQLAPDETRYRLAQMAALTELAGPALVGLEPVLLARYADADIDPSPLAVPATLLLREDPAFTLLAPGGYAGGLSAGTLREHLPQLTRPLFLAMLTGGVVTGVALEDLLRALRRALLAAGGDGSLAQLPGEVDDLLGALAMQAWLNEYVWSAHADELANVDAMAAPGTSARALLVAACYRPLAKESRSTLAALPQAAELLHAELDDEAERLTLAAAMPSLREIEDTVSREVRAQYEDHPYPRHLRSNRLTPRPLREELASVLPNTDHNRLPGSATPAILIAGCGTGQHVVQTATRYQGAQVTAVDLSRASLAFAQQRAERVGISARFLHADILQLGELDQRFDLIESAGVLHHMADPEAGWRVLTDLLADDGVMRIALYSERARSSVVAARKLFDALPRSDAEIRAARDRIRALDSEHPAAMATGSPDFYSLSSTRDLLFHTQEHRFTIPQLVEIIEWLGLEFLGFEVNAATQEAYRARFPDDPGMRSLANWDALEQDAPHTFASMYQFLLRRR